MFPPLSYSGDPRDPIQDTTLNLGVLYHWTPLISDSFLVFSVFCLFVFLFMISTALKMTDQVFCGMKINTQKSHLKWESGGQKGELSPTTILGQ